MLQFIRIEVGLELNMGFFICISLVHREFSFSLAGECDSQDLVLGAERDNVDLLLVLLASLDDSSDYGTNSYDSIQMGPSSGHFCAENCPSPFTKKEDRHRCNEKIL